jgi:hypothetical protein
MSDRVRCRCQSCTIDSLMGPAIITTIGIIFLLNQIPRGHVSWDYTWPFILVVIGLIKLASALASREGHIGDQPAPVPPAVSPMSPPPNPPGTTYPGSNPGSYPGQGQ